MPPKECYSVIDYSRKTVQLTCKHHDRCFFGSSYYYNLYLYLENSTKPAQKVNKSIAHC